MMWTLWLPGSSSVIPTSCSKWTFPSSRSCRRERSVCRHPSLAHHPLVQRKPHMRALKCAVRCAAVCPSEFGSKADGPYLVANQICAACSKYNVSHLKSLGGFKNVRSDFDWEGFKLELDETQFDWGTVYEIEVETVSPFPFCVPSNSDA